MNCTAKTEALWYWTEETLSQSQRATVTNRDGGERGMSGEKCWNPQTPGPSPTGLTEWNVASCGGPDQKIPGRARTECPSSHLEFQHLRMLRPGDSCEFEVLRH